MKSILLENVHTKGSDRGGVQIAAGFGYIDWSYQYLLRCWFSISSMTLSVRNALPDWDLMSARAFFFTSLRLSESVSNDRSLIVSLTKESTERARPAPPFSEPPRSSVLTLIDSGVCCWLLLPLQFSISAILSGRLLEVEDLPDDDSPPFVSHPSLSTPFISFPLVLSVPLICSDLLAFSCDCSADASGKIIDINQTVVCSLLGCSSVFCSCRCELCDIARGN